MTVDERLANITDIPLWTELAWRTEYGGGIVL